MFDVQGGGYNLIRLPRQLATARVCPESAQGLISGFLEPRMWLKVALEA
jgi:hypothetical protein